MGEQNYSILTVNSGSSSVKLALFNCGQSVEKILEGGVEKIGQPQAELTLQAQNHTPATAETIAAKDHVQAASILLDRFKQAVPDIAPAAIGHRIVHGGPKYFRTQPVDDELISYLQGMTDFDPEHLPVELRLLDVFKQLFPSAKQAACFDTAFHHDLPTVARLLPIPRRYEAQGVRRYGFHGLSYSYVIKELQRLAGDQTANGRLILAHMGNGVSLAAVRGGQSIDTTMALTPAAGVPMSTRSGDIDPGLALYLARSENMSPEQFNDMTNLHSGLLGISESSSDMKQLLDMEAHDGKAKDAVELFCYQVKKSIGGLAAALGGLDTLVFTGGMGENAPKIRERVCQGLQFLGIEIDKNRNAGSAGVISTNSSQAAVRVIHTDESLTIAHDVWHLMAKDGSNEIKK